MRLTQNKIEKILITILGEEGLPLVRELVGKENVSEFDLAKKIKKDIKIVRKQLYTLYNHNVVGFNRKKDKQKGWYIYYWTLLPESIRFSYFKMKRNLLDRLRYQLEKESSEIFFVCPNNCVRLNFDQSMDFEFRCPECGELTHQDDGKTRIGELSKLIKGTESELEKLIKQRQTKRKIVQEKQKEVKAKKVAKKKSAPKKSLPKKSATKRTTKTEIKQKTATKKTAVKKPADKKKSTVKKSTLKAVDKKKTVKKGKK